MRCKTRITHVAPGVRSALLSVGYVWSVLHLKSPTCVKRESMPKIDRETVDAKMPPKTSFRRVVFTFSSPTTQTHK
jgi:hypothetical protein